MSQVQSGILPEHCRAAIWIEANVKGEVDALRAASKTFADKLATFEAKFPDAHLGAVVAFGNNTWRTLSGGVGAEELKDFPGYGKGLAPTTQFDVLIHILSLRHDVNFSVAQAAMEAFGDCIEVKEEIHGFRWVEERDLSGFVDGTENPAGRDAPRSGCYQRRRGCGRQLCVCAALGAQPEAAQSDERSRSRDDDRAHQRGQRRD